jgi:hypothetical protein
MIWNRWTKLSAAGFAAAIGAIFVISSAGAHTGGGVLALQGSNSVVGAFVKAGEAAAEDEDATADAAELAAEQQKEAAEAAKEAAEKAAEAQREAAEDADENDEDANDNDADHHDSEEHDGSGDHESD